MQLDLDVGLLTDTVLDAFPALDALAPLPDPGGLLAFDAFVPTQASADSYGATRIPLVTSAAGEDLFLYYVGQYLQAVGNAYAGAEWHNVQPGPLWPNPVKRVFSFSPEDEEFSEAELPALFVYRTGVAKRTQVAEDIRVESGTLRILWVPPPAPQLLRGRRKQFGWKLMKVLDDLIERGHDLAYQIPGDQYPSAQYVQQYGTNLPHVAGYRRLRLDEIRELSFTITADKTPRSYACWETLAAYEEQLYYDLASRNWLPISAINQTLQSDPNDPLGSFVEQVVTLV